MTVVGLGPAGDDLLTRAAVDAIARVPVRFLRTTRHPSAGAVGAVTSFDAHYESAATIEDVYTAIVEDLVTAAATHGEVLYAVPGSPAVAERTVELLLGDERVDVEVVPALSFLDLAWTRLGVDPFASGARVVDGHRFATEAAGERGPLLVGQCDSLEVLSEIKLAFEDTSPERVVVLQRLGLPDESITTVPWSDLDRVVAPDHLTSLWIPTFAAPVAAELAAFVEVVRRLREECPWDRQQTHGSLTRYLLEEAYEAVEAIEALPSTGDIDHVQEELGDVLLQVVLHAAIATQAGDFTLADVARTITEKMVRRHPHVFGAVEVADAAEVHRNWEAIKRDERAAAGTGGVEQESVLDGIADGLPALMYATKVSKRAASVGFEWNAVGPVYAKVREELTELEEQPSSDELGDVLFATVNLARHLGFDAESALRGATAKFRRRFDHVQAAASAEGLDLTTADPATVDALWEAAKAATGR